MCRKSFLSPLGEGAGRKKELLGRPSLDPGIAGRVTKIYRNLPAWRLAGCVGAHGVIELAAGALELSDTQMADGLVAEPGAQFCTHTARTAPISLLRQAAGNTLRQLR